MKMLSVVAVLCSCVQETKASRFFRIPKKAVDSDSDSDSDSMATASPMAGNTAPMEVDSEGSTRADSGDEEGYKTVQKMRNSHNASEPAAVPAAVPAVPQPVLKMRFECDLPQSDGQYFPKVHGLWLRDDNMEVQDRLPTYMKGTADRGPPKEAWNEFNRSAGLEFLRGNNWMWRGTNGHPRKDVAQLIHLKNEWIVHGQYVLHYLNGSHPENTVTGRVGRYVDLMAAFYNTIKERHTALFNSKNQCGTHGFYRFNLCGQHTGGRSFNIFANCP